jgi:hypothetical protein
MALPVWRSHTTVVSRWFVMPTQATRSASDAGLRQGRRDRLPDGNPDFLDIVLDFAGPGVVVREGNVGFRHDLDALVDQQRRRAGCPLIDGEYEIRHGASGRPRA